MHILRKRPYRAALFFTLASIILGACEKPEQEIGLGVQPEDDLIGLLTTDTVSIEAFTVKEDSISTDELSISLAGNYIDPSLGNVQTSFASQLRLPTNNVNFESVADLVIDSVVLALVYDGDIYGNQNAQTWSVKELDEQLYVDSTYYSNDELMLGEELIEPGFESPEIDTENWVQTAADSLPPHLRLRIKNELGERLFAASGTDDLSNNTNFAAFFKGIHLSSSTTDAGVIRFDLLDAASKLTLYYRNVVEEDTLSFDLNLNADCARFTQFQMDYSGTALMGVENDAIDGESACYIQAGGGVKTRIEFPHILEFNDVEERVINAAYLYLPVGAMDTDIYEPQPNLFALTVNSDGESSAIPDQLLGPSHIDGEYDEESNRYRFNITRFVQAHLEGIQESGQLFLVSNSAGVTVRRVILNGPNAFPEDPDKNMELVLTFSN